MSSADSEASSYTHYDRSSPSPTTVGDPELELLLLAPNSTSGAPLSVAHSRKTAPVITGDALDAAGASAFPQRALYGQVVSQKSEGFPERPENRKLYINSNAPFSALVCGVQGSGKSHSTSVLLESCLIQDNRIGTLPAPLGGLVFHYNTAAGGRVVQPCEAAYLGSLDRTRAGSASAPPVTVLVFPTSLGSMRKVYARIPGVRVERLHFAGADISGARLLAMMKVDTSDKMPLYMESIMKILRSMDEDLFSYDAFRQQLEEQEFAPTQKMMLNLRLALLDACLAGGTNENRVGNYFREGHLTIVDLSSPFMDASSACGFFDIILGLFIESRSISTGKLVVLDEAHKYLMDNASSVRLTDSLLGIIRQQRHLNIRVVISTQEPTVVPERFLDLCSIIIAHRFSSPHWLKHLTQHISTAADLSGELFQKVVSLETGQGLLFAPGGVGLREYLQSGQSDMIAPLGAGYLIVQSRLRITQDGGHSLFAVADAEFSTRQCPSTVPTNTPPVTVKTQYTAPAFSGPALPIVDPMPPSISPRPEPIMKPTSTPSAIIYSMPHASPLPISQPNPSTSGPTPPPPVRLAGTPAQATPSTDTSPPPSRKTKKKAKMALTGPAAVESTPLSPAPGARGTVAIALLPEFRPLVNLLTGGPLLRPQLTMELTKITPKPFDGKMRSYVGRALNKGIVRRTSQGLIELCP